MVGKHCESGDIVVRDCYLPADLAVGDLLAVAATGAYCYAMASNYNRIPRPPVVAVRDGGSRLLLRRETDDDLMRLESGDMSEDRLHLTGNRRPLHRPSRPWSPGSRLLGIAAVLIVVVLINPDMPTWLRYTIADRGHPRRDRCC